MTAKPKTENRRPKYLAPPCPQGGEGLGAGVAGDGLVTRFGVAAALRVSVRTVDRMLAAGEIKPVRMRGWSVRFCLQEVIESLRNSNRKWGRRAVISNQSSVIGQQRTERTQAA
jgi:excisionase family DNA binding protein